jgi:Na+/H+ antiporter NhaD/arsenite permease-like protein
VRGVVNLLLLAGILAAVLLQSPQVGAVVSQWLAHVGINATVTLHKPWGEAAMLLMGVLSVLLTPARLRQANAFTWGPIVEVAVLFAGIFVTMVPALALLREHGPALGVQAPWQFFWLTGSLSSFLDNAPTYLTFATMAAGENPVGWLQHHRPLVLQAISCGAVFMGANTYVGNGPNFMVKAICDEAGFPTPSFFAYLFYTGIILLPVFALITYVFFWPT